MGSSSRSYIANLKDQLTSNVVTNLQAQIDALGVRTTATETKVTTLETTSNKLVSESNNSSDAGNIMTFGLGYNKTVTNALPCTGGYYSPTAYPTLFDRIGYTYGASGSASTVNLTGAPINLTSNVCIARGPVTGNIYKSGSPSSNIGTYFQVFDSNGVYIRGTTINASNSPSNTGVTMTNKMLMTNDEVIGVFVGGQYNPEFVYTSTNYGNTWTANKPTYYSSSNAYELIGVCGNYIIGHTYYYDKLSSNSYAYYVSVRIIGRDTNNSWAYATNNASLGNANTTSTAYYPIFTNGSYLLVEYGYFGTTKFYDLSNRSMYSSSNISGLFGSATQAYGIVYNGSIWLLTSSGSASNLVQIPISSHYPSNISVHYANQLNYTPNDVKSDNYSRMDTYGKYLFMFGSSKLSTTSSTYSNGMYVINLDEKVIATASSGYTSGDIRVIGDYLCIGETARINISSMQFRVPNVFDNYRKGYIRF